MLSSQRRLDINNLLRSTDYGNYILMEDLISENKLLKFIRAYLL